MAAASRAPQDPATGAGDAGPRDDTPRPEPPEPPEPADCCGGGCARCVYDLHEEAMERWREALRRWQASHGGDPPAG